MKSLVYFFGLLVLGIAGYKILQPDNDDQVSLGDNVLARPILNTDLQTQPEQLYPSQMPITPRVDNANQPWYSGSRDFQGDKTSTTSTVSELLADTTMNYGTKQFWSDLSQNYN